MKARVLAVITAVVLAATGGVLIGGDAFATFTCTGSPSTSPINDQVIVPSGATCNLQGITVNGNVSVQPGGRLIIGGGSTINGNVSSQRAGTDPNSPFTGPFSILVCNSRISGKAA